MSLETWTSYKICQSQSSIRQLTRSLLHLLLRKGIRKSITNLETSLILYSPKSIFYFWVGTKQTLEWRI